MTIHGTVRPATSKQLKDLRSAVDQQMPELTFDDVQHWIGHKRELGQLLKQLRRSEEKSTPLITTWEQFYRDFFGLTVDLSNVSVPADPGEFDSVLYIAQGLTVNQVMTACKQHFPTWQWTADLDTAVSHNDRDPKNGTYAIRVRDRVEADEELKGLSSEKIWQQKTAGITLLERVLYELKYFAETGKHLDIRNVTLCTGSRYAGGRVPRAVWGGGGFSVGHVDLRCASGGWRARAVVTL